MIKKILLSILLISSLTTTLLADEHTCQIPVLKGEKWWGIFVGANTIMPFNAPFEIDLTKNTRGQTTPFLVSSMGRYIWSGDPFSILYNDKGFTIKSSTEEVKVVSAGKTLREAYLVCCHRNFPPNGKTPAASLFSLPIYDTRENVDFNAGSDAILDYATKIQTSGYPVGTLVIGSCWQSSIGKYEPSESRFGDFSGLVTELHRRGFKVMLTITPFVSGDGDIVRKTKNQDFLIKTSNQVAFAEWEGGYSAIYDFTKPTVAQNIKQQLESLKTSTGVDGFLFDCEDAMPYLSSASGGRKEYLIKWSELGDNFDFSQYTISRSIGLAPYVNNIQMQGEIDWTLITKSVSGIINANLLGYLYSTIGIAGSSFGAINEINPQLLLRFTQVLATMPVINIEFAPWLIKDQAVSLGIKELLHKRKEMGEYFEKLVAESARTAEPIIRHLEYEFPRNGFSDCDDQYMIGSKYMAAPLFSENNSRIVRFPRGVWTDQTGKKYRGPLVTTITAEPNQLLIFESSK